MRIDKIVNDRQPKKRIPESLKEIYEHEDNPEDTMYKDLNVLYNPNKQYQPCD